MAAAEPTPCLAFFLVRTGEVLLYSPSIPPASVAPLLADPATAATAAAAAAGRLTAGDLHNEGVLTSAAAPLGHTLVAGQGGAVVITFQLSSLNKALAGPGFGGALRPAPLAPRGPSAAAAAAAATQQSAAAAATAAHPAAAAAATHMPVPVPGAGKAAPPIDFRDLELRRVVGTGQFGLVRLVRHTKTDEVFALKVGCSGFGGDCPTVAEDCLLWLA